MRSGAFTTVVVLVVCACGAGTFAGTLGTATRCSAGGAALGEEVGTLGTMAGASSGLGAVTGADVGTVGTLAGCCAKMSLSCSRILWLSEFGGGKRSLVMLALSVCFKSWRTARRRSSFDAIGIFKSPCGNQRTVSTMRVFQLI